MAKGIPNQLYILLEPLSPVFGFYEAIGRVNVTVLVIVIAMAQA